MFLRELESREFGLEGRMMGSVPKVDWKAVAESRKERLPKYPRRTEEDEEDNFAETKAFIFAEVMVCKMVSEEYLFCKIDLV